MSLFEKKNSIKTSEIAKRNKSSAILSSKKVAKDKVLRGSIGKRPKITTNELKDRRKNLIRRSNGKRISFAGQPTTITEESENKTEGKKSNFTNLMTTKKDQNMNIIKKNTNNEIDSSFNYSLKRNKSDTSSSLFIESQKNKEKNFDVLNDKKFKSKIKSSTPIGKRVKKSSLSTSMESKKLNNSLKKSSANKSDKNLKKTKKKISKVKEGRISKNNTLQLSPQKVEKLIRASNSSERFYLSIPEILKKDILEIRKKQEALKRRYPLRVRKSVKRYNPFDY